MYYGSSLNVGQGGTGEFTAPSTAHLLSSQSTAIHENFELWSFPHGNEDVDTVNPNGATMIYPMGMSFPHIVTPLNPNALPLATQPSPQVISHTNPTNSIPYFPSQQAGQIVSGTYTSNSPPSDGIIFTHPGVGTLNLPPDQAVMIRHLIQSLLKPTHRRTALHQLIQHHAILQYFAPLFWFTPGVMVAILQEIMIVYPMIRTDPEVLSSASSTAVSQALYLLQIIANHPETRKGFLDAHLVFYMFPFLTSKSKDRSYEVVRIAALGVFSTLVRGEDSETIKYLLATELIPLCLTIVELGQDSSKTAAMFVLQKMILTDQGFEYVCRSEDRILTVIRILTGVVQRDINTRLLRHTTRCLVRMMENPEASLELVKRFPEAFLDNTFDSQRQSDNNLMRFITQLVNCYYEHR